MQILRVPIGSGTARHVQDRGSSRQSTEARSTPKVPRLTHGSRQFSHVCFDGRWWISSISSVAHGAAPRRVAYMRHSTGAYVGRTPEGPAAAPAGTLPPSAGSDAIPIEARTDSGKCASAGAAHSKQEETMSPSHGLAGALYARSDVIGVALACNTRACRARARARACR